MADFRETLYTVDKAGHRKWVYPSIVAGYFRKKRGLVISFLITFYLLMPWIMIRGKQGILLDIAARKFTFFGTTFWATDTQFLVMVLGALAISLFFFTALFGRVWCGWACPETVFLEFVFRPIEELIEGGAAARRRLDAAPWTLQKLWKKALKLLAFSCLAWFIASTFLAYFVGRERLITMMANPPWMNLPTFVATLFLMGLILFQFGWFREQFCTVVCPYARFQSVMLDPNSLLVGYDKLRGEPRGKLVKGDEGSNKGDCIDCGLCVRVCPTGIDIRNGLQLECIQCAACADACDSVMVQIGKPSGLVRYATEKALAGEKSQFVRPRVVIYALIIILYAVLFTYFLSTRQVSEFQVMRNHGDAPYIVMSDGRIENALRVHVANKGETDEQYTLSLDDSRFNLIVPINPFPVAAGADFMLPFFISGTEDDFEHGPHEVIVRITAAGSGFSKTQSVALMAPDE